MSHGDRFQWFFFLILLSRRMEKYPGDVWKESFDNGSHSGCDEIPNKNLLFPSRKFKPNKREKFSIENVWWTSTALILSIEMVGGWDGKSFFKPIPCNDFHFHYATQTLKTFVSIYLRKIELIENTVWSRQSFFNFYIVGFMFFHF